MLVFEVITMFPGCGRDVDGTRSRARIPGKDAAQQGDLPCHADHLLSGFTIGGFGESLAVVATLVLAMMMPRGTAAFWWSFAGFLALAFMHLVFWVITQPVNRNWLATVPLTGAARQFFGVNRKQSNVAADDRWAWLRDKWEYSHIVRSVFAAIGLISITVAIALRGSG